MKKNQNNAFENTNEDYLNELKRDTILRDEIENKINMRKREQYLSLHTHRIWKGSGNLYYTYLPDMSKDRGIRLIKRTTLEGIQDAVVAYWQSTEDIITVQSAFQSWLSDRSEMEYISKSTRDKYDADFRKYFTDIADKDLRYLTVAMLATHIEHTVSQQHLTPKAYSNMKTVLKGLLKYAKKNGFIAYSFDDVLDNVAIPKKAFDHTVKASEEEVFNDDELELLLPYLKEHLDSKNLCLLLTFLTGCRIGEMTTAKHSDFVGNLFNVSRTQTRYKDENGKYHYEVKDSPKTEKGIRSTVIPKEYSWVLERVKETNPASDFVFLDINGKPFSCNVMNNRLHRICKRLGIVPKSPHKLRKTYASLLLDNGVDNNLVTTVMGHVDIETTENYYHKNRKTETQIVSIISAIPQFKDTAN